MVEIFDVNPNELIHKAASELKKVPEIKPPVWADFVKTGTHKERPPREADWWYVRAAAVLRSVHKLGPIGVSKLRTKYGGKKRRGHKSPEFRKGSGNILRKVLQQLEKAGLVVNTTKGLHKGRATTPKGIGFLTKAARLCEKKTPEKSPAAEKTAPVKVKPETPPKKEEKKAEPQA